MRAKSTAVWIAAACCFLAAAPPAIAQSTRTWQLSAGYSALRVPNDNVTFAAGWAIGSSVLLNRWLSLAVDVDGQLSTIPSFGTDIRLTSHAVAAGARASGRLGPFTEFGEMLVGNVRSTGTLFATTDTTNHVMFQPGIGLDYPVSFKWAVRGELDARWLQTGQQIRGVVGLVYRLH
jgi:hypothetical protein